MTARHLYDTKAPLDVRGNDLYETPTVAVHALLRAEKLPHFLWEPACGPGAIVNVLRGAGHTVLASDLVATTEIRRTSTVATS